MSYNLLSTQPFAIWASVQSMVCIFPRSDQLALLMGPLDFILDNWIRQWIKVYIPFVYSAL